MRDFFKDKILPDDFFKDKSSKELVEFLEKEGNSISFASGNRIVQELLSRLIDATKCE